MSNSQEYVIKSRKSAREFLFELLFAKSFSSEISAEDFFQSEIENKDASLGTQIDYVKGCFFGICENQDELNEMISEKAVGWSLSRISKASLVIMQICIYEMKNVNDVPKKVALNEAVELSKKFDDEKAPSFVNGILNKISHELPDRDCDK